MEKLMDNGFNIKYTHPNLLFISWGHYIPDYKRREIKKKHGVVVDGFGNVKQSNDDKNNQKAPENPNNLILKNGKPGANANDNKKKEYKKLDKYKPSGKFIYSDELMKSLEKNIG